MVNIAEALDKTADALDKTADALSLACRVVKPGIARTHHRLSRWTLIQNSNIYHEHTYIIQIYYCRFDSVDSLGLYERSTVPVTLAGATARAGSV